MQKLPCSITSQHSPFFIKDRMCWSIDAVTMPSAGEPKRDFSALEASRSRVREGCRLLRHVTDTHCLKAAALNPITMGLRFEWILDAHHTIAPSLIFNLSQKGA